MTRKRVLLTGAAGFVGSHTLRHLLLNTDWDIVCPVTFRHKGLPSRLNVALQGLDTESSRVSIINLDLTSPISKMSNYEMGKIDYVINVASESHVDRSITDPGPFILNNVNLIVNLLDWSRTYGSDSLEVFTQVSTDESYGPAPVGYAHKEWEDIHAPSNPYSASKAAQEDIAFSYWRTYDVPLVLTHTMNIIGETQDGEKFLPKTLNRIVNGESMTIHASASGQIGSRFYLHARNQADALMTLTQYFADNETFESESVRYSGGGLLPPKFHVVGEKEINNLELALMVADYADLTLKYELVDFHSSRPGHDLRYALDGDKIKKIGWEQPISLEKSIEKTVAWTLDHPEWLRYA